MLYNLLKNKGLLILLAGFILFAFGCSTSPRGDSTMFLRFTDLVNTYYYLERGKTTMGDVFKRLGEPEVRAKDQIGRDLWIYRNYEISPELILRVFFEEGIVGDFHLDSLGDNDNEPRIP